MKQTTHKTMESTKHTPGPCLWNDEENTVTMQDGSIIAAAYDMRVDESGDWTEANARLIATAPDHHANAEDTVKYSIPKVENWRVVGYIVPIEIIERHKAAIAKAEGK